VLKIFQTLVDRKGNLEKLSQPTVELATDLINQKANANKQVYQSTVLRIRIRRIRMFLGLLNPDLGPLIRGMDPDPDPSIIKQKEYEEPCFLLFSNLFMTFYLLKMM
jgi:hypothetical protein